MRPFGFDSTTISYPTDDRRVEGWGSTTIGADVGEFGARSQALTAADISSEVAIHGEPSALTTPAEPLGFIDLD
ncbi:MAG: hypothetical protein A3J07_02835 [Candidatus Doudnabacteria bacterium RIFCSPLOWO2_02_FULL_49_13]|uniref:Uncharacterized protein n=1 Tax=Candidatus Doudnabacteria bacterium RIFCSPHIGHO2_12_FULL_48_16 TaxID=1817838 RepID=A0A1F5PL00_9BACT|nr:MAG: hypothetical protein A3B77_01475 [Candidatus Doudnabacteria bacterium RIFCSPHIGHO2_02_FULL_49_24]OGE89037.1 MAG: hypothetical protein A2760_03095 [Candidatus Doudnabacteria bacterium RIFCSPHIGHO2_01_FULL_50_67]OGE90613.1 MAG: hypothetical protein A3E29_02345 [Candidatus Doudnabacteria bacterium RIFCSPHIGHO2_12_FULL_48_16]OGE96768.1 MAG: hypothetical protein A2990_03605 [Candidatus Doudnabacteria bacterium RIFCSPLOWO2_01_FULL_49_40]OGF03006.1 MAG: hypothetical protein A3J07_02835 [Candid